MMSRFIAGLEYMYTPYRPDEMPLSSSMIARRIPKQKATSFRGSSGSLSDTLAGMESCVLIKFGEMALKGRNRKLFVAQLERNLLRAVGPGAELRMRAGAIAVLAPIDRDELVARAREVIGISLVHP